MTAWLDRILGRVTMYALVIISLGIIGVAALVLGLLGQISVQPLPLLASAAVLLIASYIANGVFGVIFRTKPQLSSMVITALLLLFIFQPTLDPAGLAVLALAATIAAATKYLLAIRGRHIFNPAAAAAFIVGSIPALTGNTFVLWWIGTPALLPFTLIGALAILFRTRRMWLGAVFVVVAALTWGVTFVTTGQTFLGGVEFALLSYPTIFFAGFMLSEPLTLPPRRWQQIVEAGIVGVLFGVAFHVGPISSSPQFALIVGNLLAFFAGQRRRIRLSYVGKRQLSPSSWEFEFQPASPVKFAPGQFMELTLPHRRADSRGWRRVFSIAAAPGDGAPVKFGIRLPEKSSSFKKALLALEPGAKVTGTSVGGDFLLPDDDSKLLLVAGGIGITPYIAQLEHLRATGATRDVAVVYAIASKDDLAYAAELAKAGCAVTVVSREKPASLPAGWNWVESQRMTGEQLLQVVPDARERHTFLSGPPSMVGSLKSALRRAGARRIHTDVFIGY
jgi:ferredoxin-NADP reductase